MLPLQALARSGYALVPAVFGPQETASIEASLRAVPVSSAGTRNLLELDWCRKLAARLRGALGVPGLAVQCTLFDKTPERNWLVALHQDLAVPVRERVPHPELQTWSVKEGQHFVQAPAALLEQMVAVRLHIDDCGADNGPLRVVPGSHHYGRLSPDEATRLRDALGEMSPLVHGGGALLMKPLLLHASSKAISPRRRRVLHFLFGPASIGYGLRWRYAV